MKKKDLSRIKLIPFFSSASQIVFLSLAIVADVCIHK